MATLPRGPKWWPALAGILVALAAVLAVQVTPLGTAHPVLAGMLVMFAVCLAAVVGGLRGGLAAGVLAVAYVLFGDMPRDWAGDGWHLPLAIGVYAGAALLLGRLSDLNRRHRRRMEERSGQLYRSLVEQAPEAICLLDVGAGRMLDGNPPAFAMFGLDGERFRGCNVADLSPPTQPDGRDSREAARELVERVVNEGAVTVEWWHRRADGRDFPCEVTLSRMPEEGRTLVRASLRDITDRKRAEQLKAGEHRVLATMAANRSLSETLDGLARLLEEVLPGSIASILLLKPDGRGVIHGAGPSLSRTFRDAINHLEIGPAAGSCGTAMYHDRTVISEDIRTDPNWEPYREIVEPEGLQSCWSTPVHDSQGRVVGSFAVYYRHPHRPDAAELQVSDQLRNLTGIAIERNAAEQAVRYSEALYRATFENAAVGMAHLEPSGRYINANRQMCRLLGYEESELQRMTFEDVTAPEEVQRDHDVLEQLRAGEVDHYHVEKRYVRKDGSDVWANLSVGAVRDEAGELLRLVIVAEDVSAAHQLSEQLSYQARHDALTGLINRDEFESRLRDFLEQVRRGEDQGAVCYLDLDQFKLVNDTVGHVAGDEMLRQLSPLLRGCIRSADTLARLGGDEFGVLLRGCSPEVARRIADEMRAVIEDFQFAWDRHSFRLGVSIGVVPLDENRFASTTEVLQAADTVCYTAKDEGRNRVVVWNEADMDIYRRHGEMQWVPRLNRALDNGTMRLLAQPIVDLHGSVQGGDWFELLLRLCEPDGDIAPGAFLPAAERYGLAHKLDRKVVDMALDWLKALGEPLPSLRLSINLSGATVGEPGFRDFLVRRIEAAGPLARSLCFEITETAAISNLTNARALIEQVRERGCLFGLDDFGSGLSSFAYLKALPVDFLKIDGAFVRDVVDDPVDRAIVQSISEVAKVMGMTSVAEFVESAAIVEVLRDIGVDCAQGFWTGRPMPLEDLPRSGGESRRGIGANVTDAR